MAMRQHSALRDGLIVVLMAALALALIGAALPLVGMLSARIVGAADLNLTQYVNTFIGTAPGGSHFGFDGNSGNTFPGAAYPMGMVSWSPDTPSNLPGGYYYSDGAIKGLSLTHFSGRGCSSEQDIPFMPYVGTVAQSPATSASMYYSSFSHSSERAHPGYYSVHLDTPNVTAELSVTKRTGLGQFTYPASRAATLLINVGGSANGNTHHTGVSINASGSEVTGYTTSTIGCGTSHYTIYFAAQFDRPLSSYGTWHNSAVRHGATSSEGAHSGAFVTFDTTADQVVRVRVGISYVSIANARDNIATDDPSFDFATTRRNADAAWNGYLNRIQVSGGTLNEKAIFYTALYHTLLHPNRYSDSNGQYLGFDDKVHTITNGRGQFDNISSWDQYRSLFPLRAIIAPAETSDIAQSLVNDAQQGDGHLPRWEQMNVDSHGMNGDGAAIEIADAYAFGARSFDRAGALAAMINGQPQVRSGLNDYLNLGYVAAGTASNSAAVTQEYTNDDFAIAQFAQALGDGQDYATFSQRSGNWQNLLNITSGYIQPRTSDGSWAASFSPTSPSGFQETDAAQSTWMEPFDLRDLFDKLGGNMAVISRLDSFFTLLNEGPNSRYAFMGNEPGEEIPWEYDFAGVPSHTQSVVRRIQTQLWTNTPGGIPGNDDGGALSSWYVFSAIGLYPEIPGVGGFVIGSPLFTSVRLQLPSGGTLQINAPQASDETPYVQHLALNSAATSALWLPWSVIKNGATLDFTLGGNSSSWGSSANDAPPSFPPAAFSTSVIAARSDRYG